MIHGLVLAGGEGSRLLASGVTVPKALIDVAGDPQVVRMTSACRRVGCATVTCAVREDLVPAVTLAIGDAAIRIVAVRTPDSLHTLDAGLRAAPAGVVLCTLVDTVMTDDAWDAAHRIAMSQLADADAIVAVTPFVADDAPLWVDAGDDAIVRAFGRKGSRELVTGGVYWLGPVARAAVATAVADGVSRVRGYLTGLLAAGLRVRAVEVPRIVDVDTRADLQVALELMGGTGV